MRARARVRLRPCARARPIVCACMSVRPCVGGWACVRACVCVGGGLQADAVSAATEGRLALEVFSMHKKNPLKKSLQDISTTLTQCIVSAPVLRRKGRPPQHQWMPAVSVAAVAAGTSGSGVLLL